MSWSSVAVLVLISWGALTFGAVYEWAYIPLLVGCAILGLIAWFRPIGTAPNVLLTWSLAGLVAAIAIQVVPVPASVIRTISPETDIFLQRYAIGYAAGSRNHALSIQPRSTTHALVAVSALAILLLGLARALTRRDALHVTRGIVGLGAVLAFIGIVQRATWNGKIFGFWTPRAGGDPFGPFVNRNHFAGWMLMALPVAIGHLCASVTRQTRQLKPGWRDRLLWLGSPDGSETIAAAFAVAVMALSLLLTMSRSGMIGLVAVLSLFSWLIVRRGTNGSGRAIAGYLLFVALAAGVLTGFDRIASRFMDDESTGLDGRLGIWNDTLQIARKFPLVGIGVNTFGTATLFYQTVSVDKHFGAAHNDYLQLLAEGGVLVCAPTALVIVALARTVRRRFAESSPEGSGYWIRVGAITGIAAIAAQEALDFSLQIPGNAVLSTVLMAMALRQATRLKSSPHTNQRDPAPTPAYDIALAYDDR